MVTQTVEWTAFDLEVLACIPGDSGVGAKVPELAEDVFGSPLYAAHDDIPAVNIQRRMVRASVARWRRWLAGEIDDPDCLTWLHDKTSPRDYRLGAQLSPRAYAWVQENWSSLCEQAGV